MGVAHPDKTHNIAKAGNVDFMMKTKHEVTAHHE
jgi:hypothetical protein